MSTRLSVQVLSDITAEHSELTFFQSDRWTPESEQQLIAKMQDLLNVIRHMGKSFEIKVNVTVSDPDEAMFFIKKKINNDYEVKHQKLSIREIEVFGLVMQGYTNKEIAEKLFVCYETVKSHRKNILLKTGARNTAALISHYHQTFFDKDTIDKDAS